MYQAIMRAADFIEQNPDSWNFHVNTIPGDQCGTQGCALGWIAYFAGFRGDESKNEVLDNVSAVGRFSRQLIDHGDAEVDFYTRLDQLMPLADEEDWHESPQQAAKVLRLYAEEYHSHEKGTQQLVDKLMEKILSEPVAEAA